MWLLVPRPTTSQLSPHGAAPPHPPAAPARSDGMHTNTSQLDLDAPDAARRSPALAAAPFLDCALAPGDALYIPPGWWHYVKSTSRSFSVSWWWR